MFAMLFFTLDYLMRLLTVHAVPFRCVLLPLPSPAVSVCHHVKRPLIIHHGTYIHIYAHDTGCWTPTRTTVSAPQVRF